MASTLWTAGYAGSSLERLIDELAQASVTLVVDNRANPWSPRPEMRRGALGRALTESGLGYASMPALGAPRPIRALAFDGSFQSAYAAHLASVESAVAELAGLARAGSVCLLCAEADPEKCHRTVLAKEVARRINCQIIHLMPLRSTRGSRGCVVLPEYFV